MINCLLARLGGFIVLAFVVLAPARGAEISVSGRAHLQVPADQAVFDLRVERSAPQAETALAANNQVMEAVRKALAAAGLGESEQATSGFSIRPQWSHRPPGAAADWKPTIAGYVVVNQLTVTTARLDQVGVWIQAAVDAGANGVGRLRYTLADSGAARTRAIGKAVEDAKRQAQAASDAAGLGLGEIRSLVINGPSGPVVPIAREAAIQSMSAPAGPALSAAQVEVSAQVQLVYEAQP
ncbi:SIMPL domain-containing protein [Motiliproteus sp. SC1-56]|uniref:SIMPL domain-containing protein n=1 Tax=Motiliproteus sp. SC1-56 TaxID=2799565 RepID=UPI001A8E8F82|nr:SIMPL domain-containing protein [Motiliproteus sp. SC1-56]